MGMFAELLDKSPLEVYTILLPDIAVKVNRL